MDKEIGNATDLIDLEGSDASQSDKYCQIDNKEIDELYTSYNLMKQFCSDPKLQKLDGLDEILSNYAQRPIHIEILPKNVMPILDKRIERMLKNKRLKKNWSNEDAQILFWTFSNFCKIYNINTVEQAARYTITANSTVWDHISKLIPGSSPDSCMFKVLSLKKTKLAKQKWSDYQSKLLAQVAKKFSNKKNWRMISQELFKLNNSQDKTFRNAKQCKQHWVCYLNPQIKKGSWSLVEDKKLMEHIYQSKGSKKWAEIARVFGGRTQNALKNRYTLIIQRLRKQNNEERSENDLLFIGQYLQKIEKMELMHVNKKTNQERKKIPRTYPLETEDRHQAEKSVKVEPSEQTQKQNISEDPNCNIYNYVPVNLNIDFCTPFLAMNPNTMMPMSVPCQQAYHSCPSNSVLSTGNQMYIIYSSFNNINYT